MSDLRQAVWLEGTIRVDQDALGLPLLLRLQQDDGQWIEQMLRLGAGACSGLVVLPLASDPVAVELSLPALPEVVLSLQWRRLSARTALLAMARQLCLEDPATLFDDPLELHRQLERIEAGAALARLWCRYRCWLTERPRPLLASRALEAHPFADGLFEPPPAAVLIATLRRLWPLVRERGRPDRSVSVVVPVYGQEEVTLRCLVSLLQEQLRLAEPCARLEIVVVDDCSPAGSLDQLAAVMAELDSEALQLVRQPENLGYLRSCNRGAALARGQLLCFLNNDTVVTEGWLEELVASLDGFPEAGLVGPMLLYPDGRLQEAGGIVWRDGSAWNYGRDGDAADPAYAFCRDVDYVSGACLLMETELFRCIGGFDSRYAPAYYEDTDLAQAVQDLGYRVLMQPLSRVIHYEGVSSGRDEESGAKRFQARNAELFRSKWQRRLESHGANGTDVWRERNRGRVGRILVMEASLPTPDRDAGSLYVLNLLTDLLALGWDVSFLPADNLLWQPDYGTALQRLGVEVLVHPWVRSVEQLLEERGDHYEAILLARPEVAQRWLEAIKTHAPLARLLYYTHDLHHLRMERQRSIDPGSVLAEEIERMRTLEKRIEIAQGAKNKIKERYTEKVEMLEQLVIALRRKLQTNLLAAMTAPRPLRPHAIDSASSCTASSILIRRYSANRPVLVASLFPPAACRAG